MKCKYCDSENLYKRGYYKEKQKFQCKNCGKYFSEEMDITRHDYIYHFNCRLRKNENNKISRENYCSITNELDYQDKKNIRNATEYFNYYKKEPLLVPEQYYKIPNKIFKDFEHYTDEFVQNHYKDCMKNYDLNMSFFSQINHEEFDLYLDKFIKKNKFKQISDLSIVKGVAGIYVMVLDEYSQCYIGKSEDIKQRILSHWSKKKHFARLINGSVDTSILSIDSFGALDTTRIYYKKILSLYERDEQEQNLVTRFKKEYRLNRVDGGLNGIEDTALRNLMLLSSIQQRKL